MAKETHEMLATIYADEAVTNKTVFKWFHRFLEGNESLEDDKRSGHLSTAQIDENIAQINTVIHENQCLTILEIVEEISLSFGLFRPY